MPTISPEQLLERLAKGKPVPGILLLGEDSYLRELCRKKICDAYVTESSRDWGVKRFSADDDELSDILGQAQTLPMLANQQVIFVSDVESWERLGEDSRDALIKQLAGYLSDPAPFSIVVFEAAALDQRMRLAKTFAEKTMTVSVELSSDPIERVRLAAALAMEMAQELGVKLDRDAADELSDLLGGELLSIRTEIDKLSAYVGDRRKIVHEDIALLVVSERKYEVWALTDMLAAREPSRALEFLDNLLSAGEAAPQLLGALAWMYRKLIEAQELPPGTIGWQAAGKLKMRADAAELAVKQSRKFPKAQLTRGLEALYEADSRLKSGGTNQRAVMEFLVAQLAGTG